MPQWEPLEATGFPPAPWRQVEGSPLPSVALAGAGQWLKRRPSGEDRQAADWGAGVADGHPSRDWETPQGCSKRGPPTPFRREGSTHLPCISHLPQRGQQMGPMETGGGVQGESAGSSLRKGKGHQTRLFSLRDSASSQSKS